ncbi:DUF1232 domain-containing protein [Bacillaceae bacterium S4-13-58]
MIRFARRLKFLFNIKKSIPFLIEFFLSKEVTSSKKWISLGFIVIYAIFPFDLIPDFIVGLGIVDDLTILTLVLQQIIKMAPDSLKEKHGLIPRQ